MSYSSSSSTLSGGIAAAGAVTTPSTGDNGKPTSLIIFLSLFAFFGAFVYIALVIMYPSFRRIPVVIFTSIARVIVFIFTAVRAVIGFIFITPVRAVTRFTTAAAASTTTTTTTTRVAIAPVPAAREAAVAVFVSSATPNGRLSRQVLASLPTFVYNSGSSKGKLDCPVCLMEFEEGEKGRFLPKCLHSFHAECVDMWFDSHSTCPLCRSVIVAEPPDLPV